MICPRLAEILRETWKLLHATVANVVIRRMWHLAFFLRHRRSYANERPAKRRLRWCANTSRPSLQTELNQLIKFSLGCPFSSPWQTAGATADGTAYMTGECKLLCQADSEALALCPAPLLRRTGVYGLEGLREAKLLTAE